MNKRMPVGVDDFREVKEKYYFVDKTFFIKDLIEGHGKVTLLTRPRRFGKTLTMSMLKYFFAIDHAADNRKLFQGLAIEKAGENYMKEQGRYPVIFLTLKDTKQINWESMLARLGSVMQELYGQFRYLRESKQLEDDDRDYFEKILWGKARQEELELSLKKLSSFLSKHYGKQTIVLLDEYDVPVQQGWENGFYQQIINFMKNFMGAALKSNSSLDFAVLTGVLRISKESIFSDLNNLDVCSVMTEKYKDVLGFTPQEVERITADLGIEDKLPELKEWYDGYNFSGQEMYNPWSVVKYIDAKFTPQAYWLNTSNNGIIKLLLTSVSDERLEILQNLFNGGTVESEIDEGVIYTDVEKDENALYTMLLTTGYLTLRKDEKIDDLTTFYYLGIPNLEIKGVYKKEILDRMNTIMPTKHLNRLFRALLNGKADEFEHILQEILLQMVSYYDTQNKESFYHGLLLGLTVLLTATYSVESNRESGHGRFDVAIIPKQPNKTGVIMEFKVADREETLEQAAQTALEQIAEKAYVTELFRRGSKSVVKYGIAFYGKSVKIIRG